LAVLERDLASATAPSHSDGHSTVSVRQDKG
jgi:hypothetical protein